jgi:hypothetical protein
MDFRNTLYVSMAAYSSIHPNRAAVLNHFFCVIGNGYEWINGELVRVSEENQDDTPEQQIARIFACRRRDNKARAEHAARWKSEHKEAPDSEERINQILDEAIEAARKERQADPEGYDRKRLETLAELEASLKRWEEEKKWDYAIPGNIEERMQTTEGFSRWYPMCEYSAMVDFPDDVRPDWLDAIAETAQLILATPNLSTYPAHMAAAPEANAKCAARNKEIAEAALVRARGLRKSAA